MQWEYILNCSFLGCTFDHRIFEQGGIGGAKTGSPADSGTLQEPRSGLDEEVPR